ncbi:MAG TPA: threonine/serine dehydratase [Longimicrobium sp.]|nr:threonine/serine dehydratase [Longimicrobium sp.]
MITMADVRDAVSRIHGVAERTPLLASDRLDARLGARVLCKAENLQRTGAFKLRGAYNHVMGIGAAARLRGVVGASSGNHAQALALSARLAGTRAVVVVPRDLPARKLQRIRQYHPEVVFYDRQTADRDRVVDEIARARGYAVVPSAESAFVLAGNGSIALEILDQACDFDALLVPVGGGGLAAGCAAVIKELRPEVQVIGVEPDTANDTQLSLRAGRRVSIPSPATIADGLRHSTPAETTFAMNRRLLDGVLAVSDAAIAQAMALCREHLGILVEPSGACGLAALLSDGMPEFPGRVAVVLSGGNIDEAAFRTIIAAHSRPVCPGPARSPASAAPAAGGLR